MRRDERYCKLARKMREFVQDFDLVDVQEIRRLADQKSTVHSRHFAIHRRKSIGSRPQGEGRLSRSNADRIIHDLRKVRALVEILRGQ